MNNNVDIPLDDVLGSYRRQQHLVSTVPVFRSGLTRINKHAPIPMANTRSQSWTAYAFLGMLSEGGSGCHFFGRSAQNLVLLRRAAKAA